MRLHITKTDISPTYNGEVGASVYNEDWYLADVQRRGRVRLYIRKTDISPMYNGEVGASVYKEDRYLADVQRRGGWVCI